MSGQLGLLVCRTAVAYVEANSSWLVGTIAMFCGILGCAFSATALTDVGQIEISIWWALTEAAFWLLTLGAFGLEADLIKFAFTGNPLIVPSRLRAISLGILSFFPGFLIAFFFAALYESLRNATDPQASFRALIVGAVVGLASMLAISTVLLKRARPR